VGATRFRDFEVTWSTCEHALGFSKGRLVPHFNRGCSSVTCGLRWGPQPCFACAGQLRANMCHIVPACFSLCRGATSWLITPCPILCVRSSLVVFSIRGGRALIVHFPQTVSLGGAVGFSVRFRDRPPFWFGFCFCAVYPPEFNRFALPVGTAGTRFLPFRELFPRFSPVCSAARAGRAVLSG